MAHAGLALIGKAHADGAVLALDLEAILFVAEPDRALAFARHGAAGHLAGDVALALAQDVIDGGRDRGQDFGALAVGRLRMKAFREFFGDEAGRQLARLPARMRHQRRQERNVVANAVDDKGIERVALRLDRLARVGAWVTSLAIIGS